MSEVCANFLFLELESRMVALLLEREKRESSAGIAECVDHDDDVAGMKEAVMVSHNQDTISAIHKIVVVF